MDSDGADGSLAPAAERWDPSAGRADHCDLQVREWIHGRNLGQDGGEASRSGAIYFYLNSFPRNSARVSVDLWLVFMVGLPD